MVNLNRGFKKSDIEVLNELFDYTTMYQRFLKIVVDNVSSLDEQSKRKALALSPSFLVYGTDQEQSNRRRFFQSMKNVFYLNDDRNLTGAILRKWQMVVDGNLTFKGFPSQFDPSLYDYLFTELEKYLVFSEIREEKKTDLFSQLRKSKDYPTKTHLSFYNTIVEKLKDEEGILIFSYLNNALEDWSVTALSNEEIPDQEKVSKEDILILEIDFGEV